MRDLLLQVKSLIPALPPLCRALVDDRGGVSRENARDIRWARFRSAAKRRVAWYRDWQSRNVRRHAAAACRWLEHAARRIDARHVDEVGWRHPRFLLKDSGKIAHALRGP
jgi:hypothetical protein